MCCLLAGLHWADAAVEEEVQRVRLKNIHLANTLSKLEANIRAKEELAEGLHLIDFEQLKIENQSLNEKIEERNEELLKLRKKLTNTVQVGGGGSVWCWGGGASMVHVGPPRLQRLQSMRLRQATVQVQLGAVLVDCASPHHSCCSC
jgi:predicted RNase H-like nuclease (RuvC/YqgF family)